MNASAPKYCRWLLLACLLAVSGITPLRAENDHWLRYEPVSALWVVSSSARCSEFRVWVADSPEDFRRGLMFVRSLPEDSGMLFAMEEEREISMWMRNTYIPLDMLFMDRTGTIVTIHERTKPMTLDGRPSGTKVFAVLELPGGTVARLRIRIGDRVRHAHFGNRGCHDRTNSPERRRKDG